MEAEVGMFGLFLEFMQNREELVPIKDYRPPLTAISLPNQSNLPVIRRLDQKTVGFELVIKILNGHGTHAVG